MRLRTTIAIAGFAFALALPAIVHAQGFDVEAAAVTLEPHAIAQYLRDLATAFHTAYHAQPVLVADGDERDARLALCTATARVLANGLDLLGVSAPEKM